jgi:hypothetical protein
MFLSLVTPHRAPTERRSEPRSINMTLLKEY